MSGKYDVNESWSILVLPNWPIKFSAIEREI